MSRFGSIEKRYGVDEPGYQPPTDKPVRIPDEDTRRQYFDIARRARRDQKLGLLVLDAEGKRLLKPKETYPLAGAKATVETAGQIEKRVTATRVLALGVFALGARKKRDDRHLYLVIEGNGWAITETLKPKLEGRARTFAAQVNVLAEDKPLADTSVLDALQKLGDLRDRGILTVEEFEVKKAELLDRI